jgi:hypothetical protein
MQVYYIIRLVSKLYLVHSYALGQYLQNQCNPNDASCSPCPERKPSCIGLPDGNNALNGRSWSRDYVHCYKERTLGVEHCQNGVFNQHKRRCDDGIDNGW